ncbi:MAG TPA: DUF2891 domain-containing protein [Mycobacteriales bacterium]|jgi:hypothetical protein|nr:DUF2891 domain-containing protein [Mycobacteriales bacterium]
MDTTSRAADLLSERAAEFATVALTNIDREFPAGVSHTMTGPSDFPRPLDRNPAFYGSFDWHSCVEMHWLLVRLLRVAPDAVPGAGIRAALDRHLAPEPLRVEAEFMGVRGNRARQRPYGWSWGLTLTHELMTWDDPDAARWAAALQPLAQALRTAYLDWLGAATHPVRYGLHPNSAFGLSRALDYAQRADPELAEAVAAAGRRWFAGDRDYPAAWEPSAHDFLSPALTEAELMSRLLGPADFPDWLARFLPGIADGRPESLFVPAVVDDASDGQNAHLHGLNLSRAWCWRELAATLPAGDPRVEVMRSTAWRHADAALPVVSGSDYMVEHWLAAYAVLFLT